MKKLEVGNYIRTKKGMIAKIISKRDVSGSLHRQEIVFILDNGNKLAIHSKKVIEFNNEIIELIHKGDYINGELVVDKYYDYANHEWIVSTIFGHHIRYRDSEHNDIQDIITKEEFENRKYKYK